jgi:hypothetical protein
MVDVFSALHFDFGRGGAAVPLVLLVLDAKKCFAITFKFTSRN